MRYQYRSSRIWCYTEDEDGVEIWDYLPDNSKVFEIISETLVKTLVDIDFTIYFKKKGADRYKSFRIPAGWEFDGASIPKAFWKTIGRPTKDKFLIPAMVHDWLYSVRWNRKLADDAFRDLLEEEGVWCAKASLMWAAVRLGGHAIYAGDESRIWGKIRSKLIKGY